MDWVVIGGKTKACFNGALSHDSACEEQKR